MSLCEKGYYKPKTESAVFREQLIIHLWEQMRIDYGDFFDKLTKKERINQIHDKIGASTGHIYAKINAYIRGEIKYRPELFDSGKSETFIGI